MTGACRRSAVLSLGKGLTCALVDRAARGPALQRARIAFWDARYAAGKQFVERAVHRRELPARTDHRPLLELAVSALFFRILVATEPVTDAEIEAVARRATSTFGQCSQHSAV